MPFIQMSLTGSIWWPFFLSTFTFYFCLILMFSLAFSDYCFCPQKIKQERDWNFNFRLLSTENCFSLRNHCFAKMRQIHISMIHHKTVTVLLQKYRIDKLSIQYQIQISHFFLLSGQLCLCPLKDSSLLFTQDIG